MSMASLGAPVLADLLGIGDAVKDLAGDLAGSAIGELAKAIAEAVTSTLVTLGTLWTKVPNPDLASGVNYETPSAAVGFVQGSLRWYVAAAAILSILVAGARMAWEGRAEPGKQLMKSLATLVIVSSAGVAMIALASDASDEFSSWIITNSTQGTSFGENVGKLLAVGSGGQPTMAVMLVIVLGFLGLITSLIQIMLMIARGGLLVVLAGILPLAASATNTQMGRQWFEKAVAWTVAWILYKPAAAIVYATAFRLLGSGKGAGEGGLLGFCTGLVLMVLAVVALPALLRFTTPLVGSVAGSSSGGGAAAAAIPTGAMMVRGGGGAGGGSRGGGSGAGAAAGGATGAGMAATGVGAAAMAGQAAFKGAQSVGNQAAGDGASSGGGQSSSGGASGGGGGSNGNGSGPHRGSCRRRVRWRLRERRSKRLAGRKRVHALGAGRRQHRQWRKAGRRWRLRQLARRLKQPLGCAAAPRWRQRRQHAGFRPRGCAAAPRRRFRWRLTAAAARTQRIDGPAADRAQRRVTKRRTEQHERSGRSRHQDVRQLATPAIGGHRRTRHDRDDRAVRRLHRPDPAGGDLRSRDRSAVRHRQRPGCWRV